VQLVGFLSVNLRVINRILVALLFVACCFAPASAAENWVQVRTKNFFLISNAAEAEVRQTAARLERFREAFRQLFPQIKLDGGIRTNVVVFRDSASYAPFKPKRRDGSVDIAVAGYFQPGEDVNYITLSVGDKSAYGTIFHEYVHFLLDTNIGRSDLPPWLGEGLAEYFETLQILDDQRVSLGAPPSGHLNLLRKSELIPLSDFFSTDNSALHRSGDESRSLFYAQAWAVTHYLFHANKNGGIHLDEVLTTLKGAAGFENTADRFFGSDNSELARVLREYVNQPLTPTRIVPAPQRVAFDAETNASSLSESQAFAYLGDLLYHTGNLTEAELLLRKALKIDADLSIANISLGLVLARKKDFAEAKRYLEKAIASDAANHFAYFNYAYAVSRESMDENGNVSVFPAGSATKMRDALKKAILLNPNFVESYRLLAFMALVNDTDLSEAVNLLNKGLTIKPGDLHLRLLLAQIFLRQEMYEEAGSIAGKLATNASDADIWTGAQAVLHTINQYRAASAVKVNDAEIVRVFGRLPPLILKRSALSDAEVERYEEDRLITNLNILIEQPRFGEKQVVGYIERITCSDESIMYTVRSADQKFSLRTTGFGDIRLKVLTDGERSFTLDCGVSFAKQLTVLTYKPSDGPRPNTRGRLLSISFVPDFFRLKTPQEMAASRTVIIEDDRVFKSRPGRTP
jgi:tetratricopeptide (TPR) repeat protein